MIEIAIIADLICPWSYIGKRNLDMALAERSEYPVTIQWLPYQLAPDVPPAGADRADYMESHLGSEQQLAAHQDSVREHGVAAGIEFRFERIRRVPNTLDAHRLLRWAGEHDLAHDMAQRLFEAYFEEGLDIGDRAVLARLAEDIGLSGEDVASLLATDTDVEPIRAGFQRSREIGVRGIPTLIFQGQWAVAGVQATEALVQVLDQLEAEAVTGYEPPAANDTE
ncbi:DsbA family oxidoreductase [Pedomonas mirosovicensis]|uniref:DsbA family oxidoreductase n=1 Tax=Pedomonas mirosovicensis TaxID=2908641 RepID=UPI00216A090A|nr:DsbA family oxidoreductase [Pedomonas mirosovicensis]MCH8685215.1 DsbA family oxidoreductase [Pedomonas mirosovicensis]